MTDNDKKISARRPSETRNNEYSKSKYFECVSDGFKYTDVGQQQEASTGTIYMAEPRGVLKQQNKHRS
jgi:hypothetical protein